MFFQTKPFPASNYLSCNDTLLSRNRDLKRICGTNLLLGPELLLPVEILLMLMSFLFSLTRQFSNSVEAMQKILLLFATKVLVLTMILSQLSRISHCQMILHQSMMASMKDSPRDGMKLFGEPQMGGGKNHPSQINGAHKERATLTSSCRPSYSSGC